MTTDNFLPYGRQSVDSFDVTAVSTALRESIISRGPKVTEFEEAIADYCGAKFAVAFCNGSSAMAAAYQAAGVGTGDRVYTSPNTFIGTVNGAMARGAQTVLLDISRDNGGMSYEAIELNINAPNTRGRSVLVPVHFAGIALDMQRLSQLITKENTLVIEDAAHAIGSRYPSGEKVGSCAHSDMTMFSFHPVKTITTGEGGMITTNSEELYERLLRVRNSGMERRPDHMQSEPLPWVYEVQEVASNYHLTDFQAALGISQLSKLEFFSGERRKRVKRYREKLSGIHGIQLFSEEADERSTYHLFVAQIDFEALGKSREDVMEGLKESGVGSQVHYIPLYRHPVLAEPEDVTPYFPEMEAYYASALTLPLYVDLLESEVDRVCDTLLEVLGISVTSTP